jgi:CRISPR-associated exonuclease Cas4
MPYAEDNLLPLSALQHLLFCERQCALIHLEQVWDENRLTAEGRVLHERVHNGDDETRRDGRIVRGLRLRSLRLGLVGIADVVEFHSQPPTPPPAHPSDVPAALQRSGIRFPWPFPVEYKRGRPKSAPWDAVQLCAQALCLEEMLRVSVPAGALFYGETRRRQDVSFDEALRQTTAETAARLHALFDARQTPPAVYAERCKQCSLLVLCLPETAGCGKSARHYLAQL